jgi:hypothetical protein
MNRSQSPARFARKLDQFTVFDIPVDCNRIIQPVGGHTVRRYSRAEPAAKVIDAADMIRMVVGQKNLSNPPALFEEAVDELIERLLLFIEG